MTFWEFASNNPCTAIVLAYLAMMACAAVAAGFGGKRETRS